MARIPWRIARARHRSARHLCYHHQVNRLVTDATQISCSWDRILIDNFQLRFRSGDRALVVGATLLCASHRFSVKLYRASCLLIRGAGGSTSCLADPILMFGGEFAGRPIGCGATDSGLTPFGHMLRLGGAAEYGARGVDEEAAGQLWPGTRSFAQSPSKS